MVGAVQGEVKRGPELAFDPIEELFDSAIDAYHRSGDQGNLLPALASLVVYLDRVEADSTESC